MSSSSPKLEAAAILAIRAHEGQTRAVRGDPYIGHVFAVAALTAEYGGTLEQITAALLHDVVEDSEVTLDTIRDEYGNEVADIVAAVTEPKIARYKDRKREYAKQLRAAPSAAILVALADKTHNLETTLKNLHEGFDMLKRFPSIGWYSHLMLETFASQVPVPATPKTGAYDNKLPPAGQGLRRLFFRYADAVAKLDRCVPVEKD